MKRGWRVVGLLVALLAAACAANRPTPTPVGVDPILTWDLVTTNCQGDPITGVTYNVYAVSGAGPVPSAPSPDESPCGVIALATGTPLNAQPIAAPPYHAIVPDGVWTFAVEAVAPGGTRGALSASFTRTVKNRPGAATNLRLGLADPEAAAPIRITRRSDP